MMRLLLAATMILALGVSAADARRKRHHYMIRHAPAVMMVAPAGVMAAVPQRDARAQMRGQSLTDLIPSNWQLQPPDPEWKGRRYVAPDGQAWVALYASPADASALTAHLRTIAFAEGEEVTFLQGNREGVAVAGFKGEQQRRYFRKAVLSCGGTQWRHVAAEYAGDHERSVQPLAARIARALEVYRDESCGADAFSSPPGAQ